MPSLVGNVKINSIGSSSLLNMGDNIFVTPKSTNRGNTGSGSGATGDCIMVTSVVSATNVFTPHISDSNVKGS